MLFHRTDEQFWQMTPAQLAVLIRQHNRAEGGGETSAAPSGVVPKQGTAADLARLAAIPLA